ncbi:MULTISPECIES: cupin domain-containing protein [unclassified Kribbella]|uniref:cupin domain-containing protein n=1 Tax=unclassified Kribbella TaxID=2644121 RepID=UPI00301834F5
MTQARVVGPSEGVTTTDEQGTRADRYLIDSVDTGGQFSLVEHTLGPRVLAAPVHLHTREDEYSFVLAGRLGVMLGDQEVFAEAGTLVFKPRRQWHTFWNAGDEPLRVLEMISPGGIEALFRKLAEPGGEYDPETLPALAGSYGCEVDFEATMPIVERHQLIF